MPSPEVRVAHTEISAGDCQDQDRPAGHRRSQQMGKDWQRGGAVVVIRSNREAVKA